MVSRCARRVQNAPRHRLFVLACFVAERRVTALPPPDEKKCSSQCSVLGHVGRSAAVVVKHTCVCSNNRKRRTPLALGSEPTSGFKLSHPHHPFEFVSADGRRTRAGRVQNAPRHRLFVLACFVAERRVTALPPPDEKKCSSQCSVLGHVGRSAAVVCFWWGFVWFQWGFVWFLVGACLFLVGVCRFSEGSYLN